MVLLAAGHALAAGKTSGREPVQWAGVVGIVHATLVVPSAIVADIMRVAVKRDGSDPGPWPVEGYMVPEIVIPVAVGAVIGPPVVAAGAAWARRHTEVDGSPVCRALGWLLWSFSVGGQIAVSSLAVFHEHHSRTSLDVPHGLVLGAGLLGAASSVLMSVDAILSCRQARAEAPADASAMVMPVLSGTPGGAVLGVTGVF